MSIFGNLFGNRSQNDTQPSTVSQQPATVPHKDTSSTSIPAEREVLLDLSKGGLLNLEKREFVNLTKSGVSLSNIRAAAGWDMARFGSNIDLDLCAQLFEGNTLHQTIYYGNKTGKGIYLDGDNLTGAGDGDDENIRINFNSLPSQVDRIVIAVVIYSSGKIFSGVKNAYVRLVDESQGEQELVRYNLSEDGGRNTAVVAAELKQVNGEWRFVAVGDYSRNSISSLGRSLQKEGIFYGN